MHHEEGRIVVIGGAHYHIQDSHVWTSPSALKELARSFTTPFIATTAIAWEDARFEQQDLRRICEQYGRRDDVWSEVFSQLILLLRATTVDCEVTTSHTICVNNAEAGIPAGPLVIEKDTGHIFLVSRLFPDSNFAFISGVVPSFHPRATFHEFKSQIDNDRSSLSTKEAADQHQAEIRIAIPSRLYYTRTAEKPLAGLRFGVKDSIALKGLRTGFGNRAWQNIQDVEKSTAPCVRRLINAGAVVVGKVVSSEFCEGIEPAEWIQGTCPFNPRGDGYQKPSSSSTGSAVAVAAYEWLDFTLGTDTGGSVRHPAGVNGLFGQRPTSGRVDLDGVLGATDLFNTVGIFARDGQIFNDVGTSLLGISRDLPLPRKKFNLLCPFRNLPDDTGYAVGAGRWFPHPASDRSDWTDGEKLIEELVNRLEDELDCQRTDVNLYDFWRVTAPKGQSKCLDEAMGKVYGDLTTSSACANGIDQFLAKYKAQHNGLNPEISEIVKSRLEYGRTLSEERITHALEATAAFKQWMETTFFALDDEETTTILVFPQSLATPDYRDDKSRWNGNLFIESFSVYALGYLCGCPDYTIPVAELPYQSRVTRQTEYLPVSFSIVGKPGKDRELFDVVAQLGQSGIISDVLPGRRMYAEKTDGSSS